MEPGLRDFDLLTPHVVLEAVEAAYGLSLDGTVRNYNSYINRVFGVRDEDGPEYVVKFYRPRRWSDAAIREEHAFILDCAAEEIPVVPPMPDEAGDTLQSLEVSHGSSGEVVEYPFTLFPKRGGRNFDAEGDEQWFRLGSLVGRVHAVGARSAARHRQSCDPESWTLPLLQELLADDVIHPDSRKEFAGLVEGVAAEITPLFRGLDFQRLHGDCHRGNLLERPDEGLLVIDFDDMMVGPAVQDLWLLLPGYVHESSRELTMLLDGYETFASFDHSSLTLVEPLRFMRMVHFLGWQARQRRDRDFRDRFPWWGTKEFWMKEIEDLSTQARVIRGESASHDA